MRARVPLLLALAIVTGCGSSRAVTGTTRTTGLAERVAAVRWSVIGGCEVSPTSCPSYVVWSDGTVDVHHGDGTSPTSRSGRLPAIDVATLASLARTVDLAALQAEVGPGTCNSCVDGADLVVTISRPDGDLVLDSRVMRFDPTSPVFAALLSLIDAANSVAPPEVTIVT